MYYPPYYPGDYRIQGAPPFPPQGLFPGFPGGQPSQPGFSGGGSDQGPPSGPPPSYTPQLQQTASTFAVDPGSMRRCLHRFYLCLASKWQRVLVLSDIYRKNLCCRISLAQL